MIFIIVKSKINISKYYVKDNLKIFFKCKLKALNMLYL